MWWQLWVWSELGAAPTLSAGLWRGGRMAVGGSGLGCSCAQPALWFFQSSQCWYSWCRVSPPHLQGHWGSAGLPGLPWGGASPAAQAGGRAQGDDFS